MKIISDKDKLKKLLQDEKKLGFVPTMGAIHEAHISLIKRAGNLCNKTIVSIFINKFQFNKKIDYQKYPRILKRDIALLKKHKVDYLYLPNVKQIYPSGPNKKIIINPFAKQLCGKFRPGHFNAVVDVIDRFIKIIRPSNIFLGKKDMQQLIIIEEFLYRNKIKTKVIECKTVREKKGLACSSRNILLSSKEKIIASKIYKLLLSKKGKLIINRKMLKMIKNTILDLGANKIDYLKILNINKLKRPYKKNKKYKIFIAYYLGSVRLIDNI
ncbi:MAG TPA: pantoate--beta-alanine ligase [Pelagibacteraceae bacterium]|jgi:pantoate--beta-alanine ligase|nr:pantoate--beta-alanine ligase [Pelagibacteraceae bacterium]